ncbi:MAG: hypothetical protein ACI9FJ_002239, partial [Alteromonadaceae bacterium]
EVTSDPVETRYPDAATESIPVVEQTTPPVVEQAAEPAPVVEQAAEPAPVVEQAAELAPVVEQAAEPAPVVEQAAEPAPVVEQAAEPAPVVEQAAEAALADQPHVRVAFKSKSSATMAKPQMPDMPTDTVTPQAMTIENRGAITTSGKTAGATGARSKSHAPMAKPPTN